ncbi:MAG: V-type ATP synthase subunit F [Patescibacteria group bacterium]
MVENNKKYKIALIGSPNSILGFSALGVETFGVFNIEEVKNAIQKIEKENFAIVFITENWYEKAGKEIEKLQKLTLPAVISIPSQHGTTGAGLKNLRKIVEQAVGSDILFNK